MNAVSFLEGMGLFLELSGNDKLALEGLKRLSQEERDYAVSLARENKGTIIAELQRRLAPAPEPPSLAALVHARRLRATCPVQGRNLHCWYCSRCPEAGTCKAWLPRRADVEFLRGSEKPYSLILMEERGEKERGEEEGTGQGTPSAPDYTAFCSSYWRGCRTCPDYVTGQLRFCGRYNHSTAETAEVLQ